MARLTLCKFCEVVVLYASFHMICLQMFASVKTQSVLSRSCTGAWS